MLDMFLACLMGEHACAAWLEPISANTVLSYSGNESHAYISKSGPRHLSECATLDSLHYTRLKPCLNESCMHSRLKHVKLHVWQ